MPLQQIILSEEDFSSPHQFVLLLNQILTNLTQQVNRLQGFSGPVKFNSHVDLNGNRVINLGQAEGSGDAVSQGYGNDNFGAAALAPQIQALGKQVLQSYRQLGNRIQREPYSSFLNAILHTAPTANTSQITAGTPSGGNVSITVGSGILQHLDGSIVPYSAFNDTLPIPSTYAITSLTRSGGQVTAVTSVSNPLVAGNGFTVFNTTDPNFWGSWVVQNVSSPTQFTYNQIGPNTSTSGGFISLNNVYYYVIARGQNVLYRVQAASGVDSWTERAKASPDGSTIVAIVVINQTGMDLYNSAAGATPPVSGSSVAVIRRL